jgi:ribosomal protein L15
MFKESIFVILSVSLSLKLGLCKINQSVKILGHGDITKKLNVEDIPMSSSAAEKIKAAGGTIA